MPRAPLSEATGAPCGEGALTLDGAPTLPDSSNAEGPGEDCCRRWERDSSGNRGEGEEDAGSRSRWARLALTRRLALRPGLALAGLCLPDLGARPASTKEWRALPEPRRGES